ncbi:MAG: Rpn family recombination-promoting nuclease/putative transposase [Lachnospira sp.]
MGDTTITNAHGAIDYGMTNDYMFRALLQKSRKTLVGLVSTMLHLQPEDIKEIEITNPICIGKGIDDKTFVLDVNIIMNNNTLLDIEMQVEDLHNWPERSLCYLCRSFDQLNKGELYDKVKPVINIGFLKYTLFKDEPEFYARYSLLNEKTYRKYSDKISIRVLDLTRTDLATEEDKAYGIDAWAKVFLATTWEELRMATESNVYMDDAAQTLYELNADDNVRQQCEARRRALMEEKHKLETIDYLTAEKSKLTNDIIQLTNENNQLTNENNQLTNEKTQLTNEKTQLTNEKAALLRDKEEWTTEKAELISKIEELQTQLAKLQNNT